MKRVLSAAMAESRTHILLVPRSDTCPAIDGVIVLARTQVEVLFLQVTLQSTHGIGDNDAGARNFLEAALSVLHGARTHTRAECALCTQLQALERAATDWRPRTVHPAIQSAAVCGVRHKRRVIDVPWRNTGGARCVQQSAATAPAGAVL